MSDKPADADLAVVADAEPAATPLPWAGLVPEQFNLLRLAPQPIDRHTGQRPLRFVQLGRLERHSKDLSLLRLSIQLPGQQLHSYQNVLEVWADHNTHTIRIGPEKGLIIEPANRGLGRFLIAQGISWARKKYAHYLLEGGPITARDNVDEAARARRDHALRSQGLNLESTDPLQMKWVYSASRLSALHEDWNTDKVQVVELLDTAAMLENADHSLQEQEARLRKLEERVDRYKQDDGGLRFTVTCLLAFCLFQAGLLIWIATQ